MSRPALFPLVLFMACSPIRDANVLDHVLVGQMRGARAGSPEGEYRLGEETPPEDWYLTQRVYGQGVPRGVLARAAMQAAAIDLRRVAGPRVLNGTWTFAGPRNIGGRVLDLAVDPVSPDTLYVATASGGVWKSTDAGATFFSVWSDDNSQPIGALSIAANGVLYAGTGETGPGGGSLTYGGTGLYRSIDGAVTWQPIGLSDASRIARIAIDPTNPSTLFVAVSGSLFTPGGERGVYRSSDGGDTWVRVLQGDTPTTGAADITIDPLAPTRIFATLWDHQRMPDVRRYSGVGSGVYRSDDGGNSWTRLTNGLPAASPRLGRLGLAVAPSAVSRVYVIATQSTALRPSDGLFEGFYVSNDGGDSFTRLPTDLRLADDQASYGWWFGRIWVDPSKENSVFVAGVSLLHSMTAGMEWVESPAVHADQHAMVWDLNVPGRVYLGNDGGVNTSVDNGMSWTKGPFQPWTQFYTVDVSRSDPTRIVGGAQDNGVNRSYRGTGSGDPDDWNPYVGGDGLAARIDPTDQNQVYGCLQYGVCGRSSDGGDTILGFGTTTSQRRNWLTPVQFDPINPMVMYYAGNILNRSTDAAATWAPISPDLTGGPSSDPYPFGTITTVAAAQTNGNILYAGTDDGRVWTTRDLGANWTRLTDPRFPTAWVTRAAVDPSDANLAYVTFSGFRAGDEGAHVFRTRDGGSTWEDISANLPSAPVNDIIIVRDSLVVASDLGVFATDDGGGSWYRAGYGLPQAPITQMTFDVPAGKIFASTFGRGIYSLDLN